MSAVRPLVSSREGGCCGVATMPGPIDCAGNVAFKDTDNQNQRAANLQIMGLKTCKLVDLDNEFMGSVYAPYASVTLNGNKQIYGSIAADTVTLKGGSDVHYDEALADPTSGGATDGFIILSWTEL
jgi:hypothetical protein